MGKEKRAGDRCAFLYGTALSLALDAAGICLLALLTVKGVLPEQACWGILAGLGFVSAGAGGIVSARRSALGALPSAMLSAALFLLVLVAVGAAVWTETFWGDRSAAVAGSILLGGITAGIWSAGKRGRRKKRRSRTGAR